MKLIEMAAMAAAEMKPAGLPVEAYREFPLIVIRAEDTPEAYIEAPLRHVEVLAECPGCSRPVICVGTIEDGRIVLHELGEHLPPEGDTCHAGLPVRMAAFRKLVFRREDAPTN